MPDKRPFIFLIILGLTACTPRLLRTNTGAPPAVLLGQFEDDYDIQYVISDGEWLQRPNTRYRIEKWASEEQYLIAQNHPENPADGNLWTRIDWMMLDMAPYQWAFCLTTYNAETAAAAEATAPADRSTPRSGCNGFPFSRMKPASELRGVGR